MERLPGNRSHYLVSLIALALLMLITAAIVLTPEESRQFLMGEDGPVERASAAGYFLCLGLLIFAPVRDRVGRACVVYLLLVFGLRELEAHKAFTSGSLTKKDFYLDPATPLYEKAIGVLVIGGLAAACIWLLVRHGRSFFGGLRRLHPHMLNAAIGTVLLVGAKILDGIPRVFHDDFGITLSPLLVDVISTSEEVVEMGIPLFFGLAIVMLYPRWTPQPSSEPVPGEV